MQDEYGEKAIMRGNFKERRELIGKQQEGEETLIN